MNAKTQLPQAITEIPKYTKTTQAMTSKHRASSLTALFPLPGVACCRHEIRAADWRGWMPERQTTAVPAGLAHQ